MTIEYKITNSGLIGYYATGIYKADVKIKNTKHSKFINKPKQNWKK